jgi:PilZ domain
MQRRHPVNIRRFARAPSQHTVRLRVLGERHPEAVMQTQVISPGGCMLVSDRSIGFGSLLEMAITLDGHVVRADARAAWEIRNGRGEYSVGVEFLRIAPADRGLLDRLVRNRLDCSAA